MRTLAGIGAIALCMLTLTGCSASGDAVPAGGMGMSGAGAAPEPGIIASRQDSDLSVSDTQRGQAVVVDRVLAPADGWVVVRSVTATGEVFGIAPVGRGESRAVRVPVSNPDNVNVRVALHADRGRKERFEFDPDSVERSPDKVLLVDGRPVQSTTALQGFGLEAPPHLLSLWVDDQRPQRGVLRVRQALVPSPGWLVVSAVDRDRKIRVVGLKGISSESFEIEVPLKGQLPEDLTVTLVADGGERGRFEYSLADPLSSPDQPYTTGGAVMTRRIRVQ